MTEQLGHRHVLDNGEVALLNAFGDDKLIADTARVSYRKGTKQTSTDAQLIRYLMRHGHTSPFEHASVRLYLKAPLFVIQQLLRQRTFKFNQASARYSEMCEDVYLPLKEHITGQDAKNKQARTDSQVEQSERALDLFSNSSYESISDYQMLLSLGVARELARNVIPHGTYSEIIVTADIHNLMKFLKSRLHVHAQYEIRVYAEAILEMVAPLFPDTFSAWEDCVRDSTTISGTAINAIKYMNTLIFRDGYIYRDAIEETANRIDWVSKSEKEEWKQWATSLFPEEQTNG